MTIYKIFWWALAGSWILWTGLKCLECLLKKKYEGLLENLYNEDTATIIFTGSFILVLTFEWELMLWGWTLMLGYMLSFLAIAIVLFVVDAITLFVKDVVRLFNEIISTDNE